MLLKNLDNMKPTGLVPGFNVRFIHAERTSLAYWDIAEGAVLSEHKHPHEQVANMLSGRFEMTVAGKTHILEQGDILVIPPDVPHSGKALTQCRMLDVFCPVREDYLHL